MKQNILSQFPITILPILGLCLFVSSFLLIIFYLNKFYLLPKTEKKKILEIE